MVDVANFAARNFGQGPDLAQIDLARSRNALAQQELQMGPIRQQYLQQQIDTGQANENRITQQNAAQDQAQKIQWLHGASVYALQHPEAWGYVVDEGKKRGILPPDFNPPHDPQKLQEFINQVEVMQGGGPAQMDTIQGPGGSVLQRDPMTGKLTAVLQREPAPAQGTTDEQNFQLAMRDPRFAAYQKDVRQSGATSINNIPGAPVGYGYVPDTTNPLGVRLEKIPGYEGAAAKEPTDTEKQRANLYESVVNSERQIQDLTSKPGFVDTSSMGQAALGGLGLTKFLQSDAYRQYEAAGLRWAANILYLKSGATANPSEVQSTWKQYFPQPGDGPDTKTQKEAARLQEIESMRSKYAPQAKPFMLPQAQAPQPQPAAVPQAAPQAVPQGFSGPLQEQGPVRIQSDADYNALPKGAQYVAPDGTTRTKR